MTDPLTDERLAEIKAYHAAYLRDVECFGLGGLARGAETRQGAIGELLAEVDRLNTVLDANRVVRNAAESSYRTCKAVVDRLKAERTLLRAEPERLRAMSDADVRVVDNAIGLLKSVPNREALPVDVYNALCLLVLHFGGRIEVQTADLEARGVEATGIEVSD
jgi:hypothetical protein